MTSHALLPFWLEIYPDESGDFDFKQIKSALTNQGVNGRGWRLYLDYGDDLFYPLQEAWIGEDRPFFAPQAVTWLRILQACEMDVLPPVRLVRSIPEWGIPHSDLDLLPPLLLRAAWKACIAAQYRNELLCDFVNSDIIPVAKRYFELGAHLEPDTNQLKAGWETVKRLCFPPPPRAKRIPDPDVEIWTPVIRKVECGAYRFEALDSARALETEGRAMQHCIGAYSGRMAREIVMAFSIRNRKDNTRVGTMTVGEDSKGCWDLYEIRGRANQDVSVAVQQAAYAVVRMIEDAYADFKHVRTYVDERRDRVCRQVCTVDDDEFE